MACVQAYHLIVEKVTSTSAMKISYHRREICRIIWDTGNDKDRWMIYHFILAIYRDWVPKHHELLCSANDALPQPAGNST
jgi:hypothetical protein